MPQRKQNPEDKPAPKQAPPASGRLLKLTKMIERKTKDAEVGDLIHYSFHDQGSVWIMAHNIAALSEIATHVEVDEDVLETRTLTEIILAGQEEPLYVAERAEDIVRRVG
jgi:hypothetical protein